MVGPPLWSTENWTQTTIARAIAWLENLSCISPNIRTTIPTTRSEEPRVESDKITAETHPVHVDRTQDERRTIDGRLSFLQRTCEKKFHCRSRRRVDNPQQQCVCAQQRQEDVQQEAVPIALARDHGLTNPAAQHCDIADTPLID